MKSEQNDGKTALTGETLSKYKNFMTADAVHLYTTFGSKAADWEDTDTSVSNDANEYAEFRIIEVGQHTNATSGTTVDGTALTADQKDGSVLTFHATHSLPAAYKQTLSGDSNTGGWGSSNIRTVLKSGGEAYAKFPTSFIDEIKSVSKTYRSAYKDANSVKSTTDDKFFILSYSELANDDNDYASWAPSASTEGAQYSYYFEKRITGRDVNSAIAGINNSRAGAMPDYAADRGWWLRSVDTSYGDTYMQVTSEGNPSGGELTSYLLSVAPAFCF